MSQPTPSDDATVPDRIDTDDDGGLRTWATRLDVTPEQLRDAVAQVGPVAADVEMHLKGSRSTTNNDRVVEAETTPGVPGS